MKRLYLQLNEPGSGEIEVPLDSAMAADIVAGQWVDLKYNGDILGGFWVEELDKTQIDNGENAGRKLKASGRGALAILDDAIVWDWGTPALDNTRYFFTEDGGRYFTYPIFKKGQVLHQLIHEAIEAQTNPYGDSLDRKCWHSPTSTHLLAHVFDDANDSDGIPWDAAENEDLQARVGTSLLDLARQYSQLGQPTAPKVFDLTAVHDSDTGVTTFGIHQTAIGVTAANAIVHFRIGYNCTQVTDTENRADVRNAILTEFNDPSEPYATNTDPTSISAYRRREMLLQASNASSITEAGVFGLAQVNSLKDPKRSIAVKITDGATIKYGTHYNLGDWIYFDDGTGIEVQYRIVGIQLEWDDNYFADVVVTLNSLFMENEIRSARDLRKVGAQASGSSLMTQVSGSSGLGYWTRPPSDGAADGTVLTADGLGRSDWENVDGGSGVPGGTEHLKVLLHLDGADNSTTITDELAHTFAVTGAAALKIAYKKFGLSSLHCPPSVGAYAAAATGIPAHGTADFTWDCWVYLDALPTGGHWGTIMSQITAWNDANDCEIMVDDTGHLVLYSYSWTGYYNDAITTARTIDVHVWHHIALVRASGVFYIYIDGFRDVNSLAQSRNLTGTNFHVGGQYLTGKDGDLFSGYIDEVAVWDNAHYTGYYFDPPTMPYVLSTHVVRGTTILFRRGPIANIPPLFPGEPFIALDTGALHIGDFVIAPGSGGYGDISGTGVVGQLAEFVTNTKTLQAAKIIGPASNILTFTNEAAATLALNITSSKTLTLTAADDFNLTVPATGTIAIGAGSLTHATTNDVTGASHTHAVNIRERLLTVRNYYVRTDGNDANNGLADTAGGAFLTIQHAIDVAAALDTSIYNVAINVGDGTYLENRIDCKNASGTGEIYIYGNSSTPANVIIDGGFNKNGEGTIYSIQDLKIICSSSTWPYGISTAYNAFIRYSGIEFGTGLTFCLQANARGIIQVYGAWTISGGCLYGVLTDGGLILLGNYGVTLTGTPAIAVFVVAQNLGNITTSAITFTGSATGIRYVSDSNSIINTFGGGANYFPGNSAGWISNQGLYL